MDLLLASSDEHEWEDWIAKVLLPAAEAFGFRVIGCGVRSRRALTRLSAKSPAIPRIPWVH
jgi:hypothetical protein